MAPACQQHLEHSQIVAFKKCGNDWTFQSKPLSLMAPGIHISVTDKNVMLFYFWSTLLQIFINCELTLNLRWVCSISLVSCLHHYFWYILIFHLNSPLTTTDSKYNFFIRVSHFFNTWSFLLSVQGWQLTSALPGVMVHGFPGESCRQPCFPEHGFLDPEWVKTLTSCSSSCGEDHGVHINPWLDVWGWQEAVCGALSQIPTPNWPYRACKDFTILLLVCPPCDLNCQDLSLHTESCVGAAQPCSAPILPPPLGISWFMAAYLEASSRLWYNLQLDTLRNTENKPK